MRHRSGALLLVIVMAALNMFQWGASDVESPSLSGYVTLQDGSPQSGAHVVISRWRMYDETLTDEEGYYEFDHRYSYADIYVYFDLPETEGMDYQPQRSRRVYSDSGLHNFTLYPGVTVILGGQLKFIDNLDDISSYVFRVDYDPSIFDTANRIYEKTLYQGQSLLDMDPSTVFAPAGVPFNITVSPETKRSYMQFESGKPAFEEFTISEGSGFMLAQGDLLTIDLPKHSLVYDFEALKEAIVEAESAKLEAEAQGFYTSSEASMILDARGLLDLAETEYLQCEYALCYNDLRSAYLLTMNVVNTLNSFAVEAAVSVNLILVFMALTSSALASLVSEKVRTRALFTGVLYTVMVVYLNVVYPGCGQVDYKTQAAVSLASLLLALVLPVIRIKALNKLKVGEIGFYDAVTSVFSMAKRNLRRRKLRTVLTSSTLLSLTMGFVALTSVSTNYGLVFASINISPGENTGISVRMPKYDIVSKYVDPGTLDLWRPVDAGYFETLDEDLLRWLELDPRVESLDMKMESLPCSNSYTPRSSASIYGVIGLMPGETSDLVEEKLVMGSMPFESDTCIVHISLIEGGAVQLGETLEMRQRTIGPSRQSRQFGLSEAPVYLRVVGAFDDGLKKVRDIDGDSLLPYKQAVTMRGKGPFIYTLTPELCSVDEVVVTSMESASLFNDVGYSRVNLGTGDDVDLELLGRNLAMSRDIRVWINDGVTVQIAYMGESYAGKGFSLGVPWGIVVLNVVVTMLNTMQERKKEIDILSSIGLNPAHISGMFISEAVIMGLISGGFGYVAGLGVYPLMTFFSSQPAVEMKVSAAWCLGAIGLSIVSVLVGSVISLKNSAALTPSLNRKYVINEETKDEQGVWTLELPLKVDALQVEDFLQFTIKYLNQQKNSGKMPYVGIVNLEESQVLHGRAFTLKFSFSQTGDHIDRKYTLNRLTLEPDENKLYTAKLLSQGEHEGTQYSANYTRMLFIKWSAQVNGNEADTPKVDSKILT